MSRYWTSTISYLTIPESSLLVYKRKKMKPTIMVSSVQTKLFTLATQDTASINNFNLVDVRLSYAKFQ